MLNTIQAIAFLGIFDALVVYGVLIYGALVIGLCLGIWGGYHFARRS